MNNPSVDKSINNIPRFGTDKPRAIDVTSGKGQGSNYHAGNKAFRIRVEASFHLYGELPTTGRKAAESKRKVAMALVREFRAEDVRFLRQDSSGLWNDIGDEGAQRKVLQLLRDVKKKRDKEAAEMAKDETLTNSPSGFGPAPTSILDTSYSGESSSAPNQNVYITGVPSLGSTSTGPSDVSPPNPSSDSPRNSYQNAANYTYQGDSSRGAYYDDTYQQPHHVRGYYESAYAHLPPPPPLLHPPPQGVPGSENYAAEINQSLVFMPPRQKKVTHRSGQTTHISPSPHALHSAHNNAYHHYEIPNYQNTQEINRRSSHGSNFQAYDVNQCYSYTQQQQQQQQHGLNENQEKMISLPQQHAQNINPESSYGQQQQYDHQSMYHNQNFDAPFHHTAQNIENHSERNFDNQDTGLFENSFDNFEC